MPHQVDTASHTLRETARTPDWFALYLCLIVAAVLSPLCVGQVARPWSDSPSMYDVTVNTLVFLPFGLALRRRPLWVTCAAAIIVSGTLEVLQAHLFRTPSLYDIASNTLGAAVGALVPVRVQRVGTTLPPASQRLLGVLAVAGSAFLLWQVAQGTARIRPNDFTNWGSYPLYIGVEEIGEPRWSGALRTVRIYDRANVAEAAPVLSLTFMGRASATLDRETVPLQVDSVNGFRLTTRGLEFGRGHWRLPDSIATRVRSRLMATGEMTVVVEVIPAPRFAAGDLRILAMSEGMERRDFSIGQKAGQVYARVRTPLFGASARGVNANVVSDSVPLTITTTFDAHRFSIRTDQASAEELCLSMLGGVWVVGEGFTLTLVLLVMSMSLGFASLFSQTRPARGLAATAGAALAATGLWMTGVFSHQATSSWNIALPLLVCWLVALRQVTRA